MKQTKKLTRNQRKVVSKYLDDTTGIRLVEETKEYVEVQLPSGTITQFYK